MDYVDIYIEGYLPRKDDGVVEYTIDFKSKDEASVFLNILNIGSVDSNFKFYQLTVPYQGQKIMYAGSWYKFPLKQLYDEDIQIIEVPSDSEEGGAFYRNKFKLERETESFSKLLTHVKSIDSNYEEVLEIEPVNIANELCVVDCGQGNWNEIKTSTNTIIYDIGASSRYSEPQIKSLIKRRFGLLPKKSMYIIIISHWDMDHFQSLKYLSQTDFSKVKGVYGPSNIPPTLVYQEAIDNIGKYGVPFKLMPNTTRLGREISLNFLMSFNPIDIYRASNGRSRNQTGIVLAVNGIKKLVLLTGDHHYNKILEAIKGRYTHQETILVAPHHGGSAGRFSVGEWSSELLVEDCAVSVGPNSAPTGSDQANTLIFKQNIL